MSEEDTRPLYNESTQQFAERIIQLVEERRFEIKEEKKRNQWVIQMPTPPVA